jgi:hypothetical protein
MQEAMLEIVQTFTANDESPEVADLFLSPFDSRLIPMGSS